MERSTFTLAGGTEGHKYSHGPVSVVLQRLHPCAGVAHPWSMLVTLKPGRVDGLDTGASAAANAIAALRQVAAAATWLADEMESAPRLRG